MSNHNSKSKKIPTDVKFHKKVELTEEMYNLIRDLIVSCLENKRDGLTAHEIAEMSKGTCEWDGLWCNPSKSVINKILYDGENGEDALFRRVGLQGKKPVWRLKDCTKETKSFEKCFSDKLKIKQEDPTKKQDTRSSINIKENDKKSYTEKIDKVVAVHEMKKEETVSQEEVIKIKIPSNNKAKLIQIIDLPKLPYTTKLTLCVLPIKSESQDFEISVKIEPG
jgi:hypothetical protein